MSVPLTGIIVITISIFYKNPPTGKGITLRAPVLPGIIVLK